MKVTYYPGCSLEGTARDYADSIHELCELLGIELEEVPDWNCCGATAAHNIHHQASIELAGQISGRPHNWIHAICWYPVRCASTV
jgi:heterodisulfide reductase subunit B2